MSIIKNDVPITNYQNYIPIVGIYSLEAYNPKRCVFLQPQSSYQPLKFYKEPPHPFVWLFVSLYFGATIDAMSETT